MELNYSSEFEDIVFAIKCLGLPLKYVPVSEDIVLKAEEHLTSLEDIFEFLKTMTDLYNIKNISISQIFASRTKDLSKYKAPLKLTDIISYARFYKMKLEGKKVNEAIYKELESEVYNVFKHKKFCDFSLIEIRTGRIDSIAPHPSADKLFVEQVLINDKVQIVSGLRGIIAEDDLVNNVFLFVCNIKPSKLRGEASQGMILCVKNEENLEVIKSPVFLPGRKLELNDGEDVINTYEIKRIDANAFKRVMENLKIVNGKMEYDGKLILVDGKEILTEIKNGQVS